MRPAGWQRPPPAAWRKLLPPAPAPERATGLGQVLRPGLWRHRRLHQHAGEATREAATNDCCPGAGERVAQEGLCWDMHIARSAGSVAVRDQPPGTSSLRWTPAQASQPWPTATLQAMASSRQGPDSQGETHGHSWGCA